MTAIGLTVRLAAAVTLTLALPACGTSSSSSSSASRSSGSSSTAAEVTTAPLSGKVKVSISNYAFHPATLTVPVGAEVTFTNQDQTAHTATSTDPALDTGTVNPGHTATVVLNKPGTYTYYCQFHAFMRGTVVVK